MALHAEFQNTTQLLSMQCETTLIHHQEYQGSEEGHERVMLLIEKQALVQTIIRESARALATSKGREVSAIVSGKAVITLVIYVQIAL